ncbi:MAG: murein biosynthesis integral membrane protein MurJ [Gammaproteobacteria bacterium]|nr:murein biosynthesis integral membrane protein MurJ [Gammaproteobacteria bacterium]
MRSGLIVSMMTLLSRILGFARDVVFAHFFGAGGSTDAFFVAFKIPNFLRRLFAEGAFSQAFVPVFTEYKEQRTPEELKQLADHVAGTLATLLLVISVIGVLSAPLLILLFAPGFSDDPSRSALASEMLAITFPYIFFISLTALAGGILNSFNRFAVPAITPILLNFCLIGTTIWLSPHFEQPVVALAWGVFFAGLTQLLFQLPFLARLGLLPRPRWGWHDSGVQRILKLMLPAIFGSSVAQINLLLDTVIASFLVAGSISWLYYADRLVEFPLGIFGIAIATVILPNLSAKHAQNSNQGFSEMLDWALRLVIVIAVPATLGLLLLAGPILASLFQYGAFELHDTEMARYSLIAYSLGLPGFILIKVLAPGFYARQDTKTPVKIGIIALITNMIFNLVLVIPMVYWDFIAPHMGLALATGLSAWLQAWMLYRRLRQQKVYRPSVQWWKLLLQVTAAGLAMALSLLFFTPDLVQWGAFSVWQRIGNLLLLIGGGALVYLLTLGLLGMRPAMLKHQH